MEGKNLYLRDRMTISVPEGELGGMRVSRFEIEEHSLSNLRAALKEGRGTAPGWYTKLTEGSTLWMSDTDAEKSDHYGPVRAIEIAKAESVVIGGLGLGMVLNAALSFKHVKHVDVIERDERVIKLIGPHYQTDPRVNIIHGDAVEQMKKWPADARWDVGWMDIWPDISPDNIAEMREFTAFYEPRCPAFYGNWSEEMCKRHAYDHREHDYLTQAEIDEFEEAENTCWDCGEHKDDCGCNDCADCGEAEDDCECDEVA